MELDEDRSGYNYSRRSHRDERMDDMEEEGGDTHTEDTSRGKEKLRDSGKHRSRDRKKEQQETNDHGRSRDKERAKDREKEDFDKDRNESRERRRREERDEKDRDWDMERSREKSLERGRERGKSRERDIDFGREKDQRKAHDKDREHSPESDKDRRRERGRDREIAREKVTDRDYERGKEREKAHGHGREREKDRERDRDRSKLHGKTLDRDNEELDKEMERDKGKEKDRERRRDRERGKERDRVKDSEREKGKASDKEKEQQRDKDKDKQEKDKGKERHRDKDREKNWETDRDKPRARDLEGESGQGREWEKDGKPKLDVTDNKDIAKREGTQGEVADMKEITGSEEHYQTSEASQISALKFEERITKMKEERLRRKSEASEISSWVNRSWGLEERRKVEKEKTSRVLEVLEEQDTVLGESDDEEPHEQSGKHLAGVKILHGLDKVLEGGAVVLTLKDQNILADGDINEEIDMLENVEFGEQKNRDEAYRAAKKKTGIYDDKFNDEPDSRKTILPQYDDPIEDEGVTLDEGGRFTGEAERKLEELRKRIQGGTSSKNFEDLTSSGKITSDYYTSEEMLQFKKPKKKKSLRKKEKLDLDALEAEAKSVGLGVGDLGSRKDGRRQSAREEQEKAEAETRSDAYQSAYAKAEEASRALRLEQTLIVKAEEDESPIFGEDYEDLQKSLQQARKIALKNQDEAAVSGPQAVALQALASNEQVNQNASGEPQENKVVITEMEEFVLGLQFSEETQKPEPEDVFMDEEVVPEPMEMETRDESGGWTQVNETGKDEPTANEEKDDIVPDETIHEVAVGKGLSGALKLLKERGTLKETVEWGGRNMDKKKSKLVGIHDNDGPKEIHIERTDEFGRILTPKEAFRIISHKFHGKGPGKMKQEKRMKQYQEELKLKQMKASDTPSESMERIREAQARLKTPYLVLSGHVKPGQTSDPRSGFATVEKDHLGSLTPMLGDRKVEHFLGIKRKDESGSMGPPPPKKPKS